MFIELNKYLAVPNNNIDIEIHAIHRSRKKELIVERLWQSATQFYKYLHHQLFLVATKQSHLKIFSPKLYQITWIVPNIQIDLLTWCTDLSMWEIKALLVVTQSPSRSSWICFSRPISFIFVFMEMLFEFHHCMDLFVFHKHTCKKQV